MAEHSRKHPPAPVIAIVLVALLGGGGWWWWTSTHPSVDDGVLRADGTVEATEYRVTPALAAPIATLAVAEGDTVAKGAVIAKLDATAAKLTQSQAEQGVTAAQAALDNAKGDKDSTKADVKAAKARLAQAKAAVSLAKVQVGYATLKAPADGVITAVLARAGENAAPGRVVVTMVDAHDPYCRVYVPETRIGGVATGAHVEVTTDSSTQTFTGTVSFVASQAEFTPNTVQTADQRAKLVYEVRIALNDPSGTLKPGMPVTAAFR